MTKSHPKQTLANLSARIHQLMAELILFNTQNWKISCSLSTFTEHLQVVLQTTPSQLSSLHNIINAISVVIDVLFCMD